MAKYEFDTAAFVEHMGGLAQCRKRLAKMGITMSSDGVNKWRHRGNIQLNNLVNLLADEALEKSPLDINRFIRRVSPPS